ncbi:hypothetical protein LSCM1_08279 [Leishmania martiniquensis]|uniref:Uncharacterized protein n=1 Tax=Leishmania martiniquensis TaxID=1580590 RepID=A0A836H8T8_9TRYP|nr:hypothetical protein LSCM1_08279 [Leishmania martiniquensis]
MESTGIGAVPAQSSRKSCAATFSLKHVASVDTPLTCNCLLAAPLLPPAEFGGAPAPSSAVPEGAEARRPALGFLAASYELTSSSLSTVALSALEVKDGVDTAGPRHIGECAFFQCAADADGGAAEMQRCASGLPGVFDLVSVPASFFGTAAPFSAPSAPPFIAMACTDGSVRVLDPFTLSPVVDPLRGLHAEMLTSCTALCCPTPHLLCSAHTGAVFLCSVAERCVTQELEGHEYDAWCTAMMPTGGWWSAAPADLHANGSCGHGNDTDGEAETAQARCSRLAATMATANCTIYALTPVALLAAYASTPASFLLRLCWTPSAACRPRTPHRISLSARTTLASRSSTCAVCGVPWRSAVGLAGVCGVRPAASSRYGTLALPSRTTSGPRWMRVAM